MLPRDAALKQPRHDISRVETGVGGEEELCESGRDKPPILAGRGTGIDDAAGWGPCKCCVLGGLAAKTVKAPRLNGYRCLL